MENNNIKNPEECFVFHVNLTGYNFYLKNKLVPRFVLYLRNLNSEKLISGNTKYKVVPRG